MFGICSVNYLHKYVMGYSPMMHVLRRFNKGFKAAKLVGAFAAHMRHVLVLKFNTDIKPQVIKILSSYKGYI